MSLINNMLKDLDKRQSNPSSLTYIAVANTSATKSVSFTHKLLLAGIIFLSLTFLLTLALFKHKPLAASQLMPLPVVTNQSTPVATPAQNSWLNPIKITGVTLQVKENITELTFFLSNEALYRLVTDNIHNRLSLIIDKAELQSEIPTTTLASAIQHINNRYLNGDIYFDLTLYPDTVVKYVNLNTENKNPELVIAFETPSKDSGNATNSTMIKTPAIHEMLAQQYRTALSFAAKGQYSRAINDLSSVIKMDPLFYDARVSLVALLIDQSQSGKAKSILEDGLRLTPDYLPLIELKARLLTSQGKIKDALSLLLAMSPPINENPDYHAFIAALYERNNNDILAVKLYRQLLEFNSQNGNWWFGLGVSLDKLGHTSEAVEAYSNAANIGHLTTESALYLQKRLQSLQELVDDKG